MKHLYSTKKNIRIRQNISTSSILYFRLIRLANILLRGTPSNDVGSVALCCAKPDLGWTNLNKVDKYIKGKGGYLIMSDGSTVDVSRSRKEVLLKNCNRQVLIVFAAEYTL